MDILYLISNLLVKFEIFPLFNRCEIDSKNPENSTLILPLFYDYI